MPRCVYKSCKLPDNNYRFVFQLFYIIVGVCVLLSSPDNFTFFQTILFIAPVFADIVCSGPTNKIARAFRWILGSIDLFVILICILGLADIIYQDADSYFIVESMVLFGGLRISLVFIALLLVANLGIPIAYYFYSPCKKNSAIKASVTAKREVKS